MQRKRSSTTEAADSRKKTKSNIVLPVLGNVWENTLSDAHKACLNKALSAYCEDNDITVKAFFLKINEEQRNAGWVAIVSKLPQDLIKVIQQILDVSKTGGKAKPGGKTTTATNNAAATTATTINASTTTTNNATTTNNNAAATTSTNNAAATTAATLNPPPPPNPTGDIYFQFFFGLTAKELAAF
jgi:activator of HSP90 ATPase